MAATLKWFSGAETGSLSEFNGGQQVGTPVVQSTTKRSGTYALKSPTATAASVRVNFGAKVANAYARFYVFIAADPSVKTRIWRTGGTGSHRFDLNLKTNGTLEFAYNTTVESTGSDAIPLSAWNLIEVHFVRDNSVGGMECYLNGVLQFSNFTINTGTPGGGEGNDAAFWFGPEDGGGQDVYYDDMAIATGAYIGAGQCAAFQGKAGTPTYDAWTKNGDTTAALCWSETPFSNGKNCSDQTTTDKQTMLVDDSAVNAAIGSAATINGAFVCAVAKVASSSLAIKLLRRVAAADTVITASVVNTNDRFVPGEGSSGNAVSMGIFTDTRANLAGAEIGAQGNSATITQTVEDVWLMVDFTPVLVTLSLDLPDPLESAASLSLDLPIPLESLGETLLSMVIPLELESLASLALGISLLLESFIHFGGRGLPLPLESDGKDPAALDIIFDILNAVNSPLLVTFDIEPIPDQYPPNPLLVTFDIIEANPDGLTITFSIVEETLIRMRTTEDVQAPVAQVTFS